MITVMIVILMGVSGSGKSTVGRQLATELGWHFIEGDEFHPAANVEKMSQGIPLNDDDRWPWLTALRQKIAVLQRQQQSAVVACSALKQRYREWLQPPDQPSHVRFVYLKGSFELLRSRLEQREAHFMPADMLHSQFETLEEPGNAITIDLDSCQSTPQVLGQICQRLQLSPDPCRE